jgi:hypothetical protein
MDWNLGWKTTFPFGGPEANMQYTNLNKVAKTGLVAFLLGGSTLVSAGSAGAADLGQSITDQGVVLERLPAERRIVVEENGSAPPIEHNVFEGYVVEGFEGPALVPPQYLPAIPAQASEGYEGPALIPPQYVPVAPGQTILRSRVDRQRIVHMPAPAVECRVVVTKQSDAFGDIIVRRIHTCN